MVTVYVIIPNIIIKLIRGSVYFRWRPLSLGLIYTQVNWSVEELLPYTALYIPGRWAHRSINVGDDDLLMLFVYPAHAGHDYATIETKGFRKLIIEDSNSPKIIDNPKWK